MKNAPGGRGTKQARDHGVIACLLIALVFIGSGTICAETITTGGLPVNFNYNDLTFSTINFPGISFTQAFGINTFGEIVGTDGSDAFTYSRGAYGSFDVPGSAGHTGAIGVNNLGQVVGEYDTPTAGPLGFFDSKGTFTTVTPPNARASTATGINDEGLIVGQYSDSTHQGNEQGFAYDGMGYAAIDFPGASGTGIKGVNDLGEMVGYFYVNNENTITYSFVFDGGNYWEIDLPGCISSAAFGINDWGQVVGECLNSDGTHGFVDSFGHVELFDFPGSSDTAAFGINDLGQIVGQYNTTAGTLGFVATPATEGGSTAEFLLVDLTALGIAASALRFNRWGSRKAASFPA